VKNLSRKGYSAGQLLSQLADAILKNGTLAAKHKAVLFEKIAVNGSEETLTLYHITRRNRSVDCWKGPTSICSCLT
jgi:hypothetical protein